MKKIFSLMFVLALITAIFVSCGGTKTDDSNTVILKKVDNLSEYVIVRNENSSSEVTVLASSLRKAINEATDTSISIKTDYNVNTYEILVGETKRQQSIDAHKGLRYYDYVIKTDGNKIVIAGGSEKALGDAIELFKTQFIDAENKTVRAPSGNPYIFKRILPMDSISIDGVDISEFKILNHSLLDDVSGLRDRICEVVGTELDITKDIMLDDVHYIILEATELIADKYSVTVENGNVIIKGSAHSLEEAMDAFVDTCLKKDGVKSYNVTSADNFEGSIGKKDIYTRDQLMALLEKVYADPEHIIIGEQVCGNPKGADNIAQSISLFENATGQKPGIIGIDLACYGLDLPGSDDATWSSYICDIVDFAADGGIITASAHWANPSGNLGDNYDTCRGNLGYDNTLIGYQKAFTDLITEGTEYNTVFKKELEANARFFKALEDNGVPIIWRPLHEANGNWFWFCTIQNGCTLDASYLIDVWHYVYDYFENECGLNNLVWCYGPNTSSNTLDDPNTTNTRSTTYLYPGDEYCDMVGVDWYTEGNVEIEDNDNYLLLAEKSGKPAAITEFGTGGITTEDPEDQIEVYNAMTLYYDLYDLIDNGYSFTYLITWYNRYGITYLGLGDQFMETEMTLNQGEVKAMLDALK